MPLARMVITGVNGFVGRHLAEELRQCDIEVIGIGRESRPHDLVGEISYFQADLTVEWPDVGRVDSVIHLAGLAAVGPSFDQPQAYIQNNSAITTIICEHFLRASSGTRIIGVSSGTLYSGYQQMPVTEESALDVQSPYAVSKLLVENQFRYYANRGLDCVVARPFNHIGPGQGRGFLIPDLFAEVYKSNIGGTIPVGNLATSRDYTDVRDIARAYRLLAAAPHLQHRLYNVSSGKSTSGNELLELIRAELRRGDVLTRVEPRMLRPTDPFTITGDSSRIRTDVGWLPSIGTSDTIADFAKDLRT
jgi:GDP-4-dehydro-6-deoxy-D-mannose reductase